MPLFDNPLYPSSMNNDLRDWWDEKQGNQREEIVPDSGQDAIQNLANSLDMKLNQSTKDYLTEYYLNEKSNENAWKREMDASNTQYQRAVEDLRKAGLNPFLAISSLSGSSSPSSSGQSVTGGLYTSKENNKRNATTSALAVLGIIAAAVIKAIA